MHSSSGLSELGRASVPLPAGADVRRAVAEDVSVLSRVLARAFDRDPFMHWLVRQDERRSQRMEWTFDVMLRRLSSDLNETYTNADLTGGALWKRPGEFKLPLGQQLQLLPAFARSMGWSRIPAFLKLLQHMEALHERLAPEPHFYLFVLGVDPDEQRRGLGSQLLAPVLSLCDRDRKRSYLETSREENLPFYVRQGFEVAQIVERPGWPKFWLMLREPRVFARDQRP
jgi:ribosomal protein S18 acetylase RimI-like enzyme